MPKQTPEAPETPKTFNVSKMAIEADIDKHGPFVYLDGYITFTTAPEVEDFVGALSKALDHVKAPNPFTIVAEIPEAPKPEAPKPEADTKGGKALAKLKAEHKSLGEAYRSVMEDYERLMKDFNAMKDRAVEAEDLVLELSK